MVCNCAPELAAAVHVAKFWTVVCALELIDVSASCAVERLVETTLAPAVKA